MSAKSDNPRDVYEVWLSKKRKIQKRVNNTNAFLLINDQHLLLHVYMCVQICDCMSLCIKATEHGKGFKDNLRH